MRNQLLRKVLFTLTTIFIFQLSLNAQLASVQQGKQLVQFCDQVTALNQYYQKALFDQKQLIEEINTQVEQGKANVTFPIDKITFKSFYGNEAKEVASIERTYALTGADISFQQAIVNDVKKNQREIRKLDMLVKSWADFINSGQYLNEGAKSTGKFMTAKVEDAQAAFLAQCDKVDLSINEAYNVAESKLIDKHDFSIVLKPVNDHLLELGNLYNLYSKDGNESLIAKVQEKRNELAVSKEKRVKEAKYTFKSQTQLVETYETFDARYQAALTQYENFLSKDAVSTKEKQAELVAQQMTLEQLRSDYLKMKEGNSYSENK